MSTSEATIDPIKKLRFHHPTGAYFLLVAFFVVSFARPQDWIPQLAVVPLAKISGVLAVLAYLFSFRQVHWPPPRDAIYLLLLLGQLFATVPMSPVWPGGALQKTLGFSKVVIMFIVTIALVTTLKRLYRLILIQCTSVVAIATASVWEARFHSDRLGGAFQGSYTSNANDLALIIVTTVPLSLALMFLSRGTLRKSAWALATLLMVYVVFLTASRGGFISLVVTGTICLWEFAIRGRRRYLLLLLVPVCVVFWQFGSGTLVGRLKATFDPTEDTAAAYSSAQQREQLLWRSLEVTEEHPLFGVGPGNFMVLSGEWRGTHNAFTQMSSEGGVPALIFYLLFVWCGFKNVRLTKLLTRGHRGPRLLARALRASLIGYLFGACFASTAYDLPYFLVAYTTALVSIVRKSASLSTEIASSAGRAGSDAAVSAADALEPSHTFLF